MKSITFFIFYTIFLIIFFWSFSGLSYGQINSDTNNILINQKNLRVKENTKTPDELLKEFEDYENARITKSKSDTLFKDENISDDPLDSFIQDVRRNYYKCIIHEFKHRTHVFTWQFISSIIIFFIVISLVVIGVYFAWLQFKLALKELEKGKEENLKTDLTVSPKEIKLSSPVLGIIILIISLLFLYLYLIYIYPITEIL
jgi:hypothetical protein